MTAAARQKIRQLTLAGERQNRIAAKLGVSRYTIWNAQRQMKLRQWVPDRAPLPRRIENRIVAMLRRNISRIRIGEETGVSQDRIHAIAHRVHFRRRRGSIGCSYQLTATEIARLRRALTRSEEALCRKFGVSRQWLRSFRVGGFSRKPK